MKRILITLFALSISLTSFTQSRVYSKNYSPYEGENEKYKWEYHGGHGRYTGDYYFTSERVNYDGKTLHILKNDKEYDEIDLIPLTGDETWFTQYNLKVQTLWVGDVKYVDDNPTKIYFDNFVAIYEYDLKSKKLRMLPIKYEKGDLIVIAEVNKEVITLKKWKRLHNATVIDRSNEKIIKINLKDL